MNQNELYHYGVLGMKWGTHRARVNAVKADRARKAGKKDLADKYQARSNKIKEKHTARAGGKDVYNRVANSKTRKLVLQSALMGTYGALKYNKVRARGEGRVLAGVKGTVYGVANRATGGVLGFAEPRIQGRDYKRKKQRMTKNRNR